jgi:hypothetical protein
MRTALSILTEKKRMVYGNLAQKIEEGVATEREIAEADNRWVNFLEAQLLMATVDALCLIDDPTPEDWGKRLEGGLGRAAARLISLGEPVPADKLILKP